MMPLLRAAMLAVSSSLAASIVFKATIGTALGLGGAWLARGNRAAVRHALLAAAFGVLLALPIASAVAPPVNIEVSRAARQPVAAVFVRLSPAHAGGGVAAVISQSAGLSAADLLLAGWLAGAALFLLPVAMGLWQVRRLRGSAVPWRQGQLVADTLAREGGMRRRAEVLLHPALAGPMTCEVRHPAIVLPQDAETWDGEDLDRALVHELEHVRRGDWAIHCMARALCAVYWFHPLVWLAWRQLEVEAERACDDAVLERSDAAAYADQLVGLARRLSAAAKSPLLAMANCSDLTARVHAVLDSGQPRGRAGRLAVSLACAAAVLAAAMAPVRMVAAPQAASPQVTGSPMVRFRVSSDMVMVDVVVKGKSGKNVEGLSAKDFAITEDGAAQTIGIFEFQKPAAPRDSVSSYYVLGYYTRNTKLDDNFRKINVTCKGEQVASLDYRMGYYARNGAVASGGAPNLSGEPGVTPPQLIYKKEPEYSEEARKAKYQGTALLLVDVDASGHVTGTKVIRSLGLGLDEKAVEAVRQWRFRPGMKDGKPVAVQAEVEVNFRLL
jgi:TonB family protein